MRTFALQILMGIASGTSAQVSVDSCYERAYAEISGMLEGSTPSSCKRAVYLVENAYFNDELDRAAFEQAIQGLASIAQAWAIANPQLGYRGNDPVEFARSAAVFHLMTDTVFVAPGIPLSLPLKYDTVDFFALHDWTKMFVTKLLITSSGNCHSMPLLYKMLCDELGTKAYLALAPNHMYIKQHSAEVGWYNTELTSASFPSDAWLMASGYVSTDAIRSGIYMDTLSAAGMLALCLVDLAQGYHMKYPNGDRDFELRCCDLALKHYPQCVSALLLKVEALDNTAAASDAEVSPEISKILKQLVQIGYREIPLGVYLQWLGELVEYPDRYANPMLNKVSLTQPRP